MEGSKTTHVDDPVSPRLHMLWVLIFVP